MRVGINTIMEERDRQIRIGHTPQKDTEHVKGQLALFAVSILTGDAHLCPFGVEAYKKVITKHTRYVEFLAIAGALIAAEIDRLHNTEELSIEGNES